MHGPMTENLLDTRGLNCPLPVLKARKKLKTMTEGESLRVLASDPRAPDDFAELCAVQGHELVSVTAIEGGHDIRLVKRNDNP